LRELENDTSLSEEADGGRPKPDNESLADSFANTMEILEEVTETLRTCEGGCKLYPGERTEQIMVKLYTSLFEVLQQSTKLMRQPTLKRLVTDLQIYGTDQKTLLASIAKIRQVSASVMKEVEHSHHLELREAHSHVKAMERDQQKMLMVMKDQRKIMSSLKEERILIMIIDQQSI
jgi:hypothetical protein